MNDIFNNMDIFRMASRWRKHLIVITGVSALLAVFFSSEMFIKPKFKSVAVIYPSNLIPYGVETPTEQMLQLFQSNDIREAMMRKFNLWMHYDVDSMAKSARYYLNQKYDDTVRITKTDYEAVKIEIDRKSTRLNSSH